MLGGCVVGGHRVDKQDFCLGGSVEGKVEGLFGRRLGGVLNESVDM